MVQDHVASYAKNIGLCYRIQILLTIAGFKRCFALRQRQSR
jgi:hypothetical protein